MSTEQHKAAVVRAPNDIRTGTNDDFGVRRYTSSTTSRADAVPGAWAGHWVRIYLAAGAGDLHYGFSLRSGASIDETKAAADGGTNGVNVGDILEAGSETHVKLPTKEPNETLYFVRAAVSGTPAVTIRLASGD